ncbi:MFS transporter [Myxococcota bacterium]|nr:MFS transporter [Myxococcota bacterium]
MNETTSENDFQAQVQRDLRRNYLATLGHGLLGQTGMRILNAPTFLPAYIFDFTGSDAAVGAARAFQYLGNLLSPLLGALLIEHRPRVLGVGMWNGVLMRLQILGLGLAGLLLPDPFRLLASWLFLGLFGFFGGIQGVVFNMVISKVIPVKQRGILLGLRTAASGITASLVAVFAGRALVETNVLGNGYATTFLVAFALTSLGLVTLLFIREPASPDVRVPSSFSQRLRELPELLRSDRSFTRYFLARALGTIGQMAVPFYIIYAEQRIGLDGDELGVLTAAFVMSQSVTNLGWGALADRRGFRFAFLLSLSSWMLAAVMLIQSSDYSGLLMAFAVLGAGIGGFEFTSRNMMLEFGSRRNLPMRIAVANSAAQAVAAIGAVAGGFIASAFSYSILFWIAFAFQACALVMVMFGVDEPRYRNKPLGPS